ncbi:CLUMA_CG010565, isoform A [Clunio marinus]|uniref:CLUMA_CG010565, isoform A n=1 Tax=Clunio marinus TaxID=568069 RepID=A0A1J1IA87_9DIPT|nr:CLUMA_CG010565, isoform A [Clunio marinus]
MLLRFLAAIICLCSISCVQFKVIAEKKSDASSYITLKCNETEMTVDNSQEYCALKSTRCVLSGYKIDNKYEASHPKEAYYISCLIFDKTTVHMIPTKFFGTYVAVKYIDLSHSKIHKIADLAFELPLLTEIDLSANELISLTADIFAGANHLETINLSYNKISILDPQTFVKLRSLSDLNLSHNNLFNNSFGRDGIDWTDGMESLKTLDLSFNHLTYQHVLPLQAFSGLSNLINLNLRSNQIVIDYGAFSSNQNLQTLDLSYNKMTYFDLDYLLSLESLRNLYLHGNGISYADQINLDDVKTIFPELESIGLSENSFSCEVLSVIIKKMAKASIHLVVEDGMFKK